MAKSINLKRYALTKNMLNSLKLPKNFQEAVSHVFFELKQERQLLPTEAWQIKRGKDEEPMF